MSNDAAHIEAPVGPSLPGRRSTIAPRRWTMTDAWTLSTTWWRLVAVAAAVVVVTIAVWSVEIPVAAAIGLVAALPAALVDVLDRRLPDRLVARAALAMIAAACIEALTTGTSVRPVDALLGAALLAGPIMVLHLVSPAAMGFGDVKASIVLGAALGLAGPNLSLIALLVASAGTAATGLATRHRYLPFGPGLVLGSMATISVYGVLR